MCSPLYPSHELSEISVACIVVGRAGGEREGSIILKLEARRTTIAGMVAECTMGIG